MEYVNRHNDKTIETTLSQPSTMYGNIILYQAEPIYFKLHYFINYTTSHNFA